MKKTALMFPGQGSQYVGMGKDFYENYSCARQVFEEASDILGLNLKKLCFEGSIQDLTKTENTQPAILTVSTAAFRVYMQEIGVEPVYLCGHSLGEITALTCAGSIDFPDSVKITYQRGKFMQEAATIGVGAMFAISGISPKAVEDVCKKVSAQNYFVVVSNYNALDQSVISGHKHAVEEATELLKKIGGRAIPLKVSAPFHSPLMQSAAASLKEELTKYSYKALKWPVISNVTSLPYGGHGEIVEMLSRQMTNPVQWLNTMKFLQKEAVNITVEIGPRAVLKKLVAGSFQSINSYTFEKLGDVESIKGTALSGSGKKLAHANFLGRCLAMAVCTKNYNWDNEEYNKGVVEPYNTIQRMQEELENSATQPSVEQMHKTLELLRKIFITKKVVISEQIDRFNQIFDETDTRNIFSDFVIPVEWNKEVKVETINE